MVALISPDPISLSTLHLHMGLLETDTVLSSATGFTYQHGEDVYLVTNWHNVTGRDPSTGACLSDRLAVPNVLATFFRHRAHAGQLALEQLKLYRDDDGLAAAWLEHPTLGHRTDVVVLPLPRDFQTKYLIRPVNTNNFDPPFKEEVADDAFVIGYPFSDSTALQLPIWKRASIASEPDIDVDQLPKILIDTATRSGLSGSPVIMQRIGIHGMKGGVLSSDTLIGRIRNFIGVYSGRVGTDAFKAQLGVVWKARVIPEIIAGNTFGAPRREDDD